MILLKAKLNETNETLSKFIENEVGKTEMSMKKQYNSKQRKIKLMKIRKSMLDAYSVGKRKKKHITKRTYYLSSAHKCINIDWDRAREKERDVSEWEKKEKNWNFGRMWKRIGKSRDTKKEEWNSKWTYERKIAEKDMHEKQNEKRWLLNTT